MDADHSSFVTDNDGYFLPAQTYVQLRQLYQQACALQSFFSDVNHKCFVEAFSVALDQALSQTRRCKAKS